MHGSNLRHWEQLGREYRHRRQRIFYRHDGAGPVLLCIHGFPTASWDWHKIWEPLAADYRLVAPDLIGFGFSAKPKGYDYTIFDQADLIEGLLSELGIEEVDILAHDYGDTVAQELLARRQERSDSGWPRGPRIRSVCFLNGGLIPDANRPLLIQKLLASPLGGALARLLGERTFRRQFSRLFAPGRRPGEKELSQFWELVSRDQGLSVVPRIIRYLRERQRWEHRWVGVLAGSDVPLRLIDGAADSISGRRMARRYAEIVPVPDVVVLDDVGHYPQLEAPQVVLKHLREFLGRG